MKKNSCPLLFLFVLALVFPAAAQTNYLTWSTNADNTLTITSYFGPPGAIFIPSNINGLTVTIIGNGSSILPPSSPETSISIPETVVSFGVNAFAGGGYLTNLNVPSGLTNIGPWAFYGCFSLPEITIPSNITKIGLGAFAYCSSLTNIVIPESVTNIGSSAFEGCSSLTSIIIPASVTQIAGGTSNPRGGAAFDGCTSLTNVNILGAASVEPYAFSQLPLVSLSIAGGSIGELAFSYCTNLTQVTLGPGVSNIDINAFLVDPISSLTIPASVTNIGASAFQDGYLTNLTFAGCPTGIGEQAFLGAAITRLYLPGSITGAGAQAFFQCDQLTNLVVAAGVTNLTADAFEDSVNLTSILFLGNAPTVSNDGISVSVFAFDPKATVYYLPGTTGWTTNFGITPTALWNPTIQGAAVSNGQFGFNITGTSNIPVVVEACTNLASPVWVPLQSFVLTNGSVYFSDTNSASFATRYYGIGFP
jgi:hypothetical protein